MKRAKSRLGKWLRSARRSRYLGLARLSPRVAIFQIRARMLARRLGHDWALRSATPPHHVREILRAARGRLRAVELGTGPAWTTVALALADADRQVVTFDPVAHEHRDRYLGLVAPHVRSRIDFRREDGVAGISGAERVDFLFIDSLHDRETTLAEFRAWRPLLSDDAVVVFHDHGTGEWPGVDEAVEELGLEGQAVEGLFIWRARAEPAVPAS